ncbi:MAG: hypothetical protein JO010_13525, partial [Alphaproteobacteria bacterium]|nr:hypothetical protein [Alphaproteobacteria bacterium]
MMNITVALDILVAALLVAMIVYAMLLSRRLGALRNDKQQLEALVASLDASAQRAEAGIATLKAAADQIGQQLQQRLDQGQSLRTDLAYIVELGGGLADRLEAALRAKREDGKQRVSRDTAAAVGEEAAKPRPRKPALAARNAAETGLAAEALPASER